MATLPERYASAVLDSAAASSALKERLHRFWRAKAFRTHEPKPQLIWIPAKVLQARVTAAWMGTVRDSFKRAGERPVTGDLRTTLPQVLVPLSHGLTPSELNDVAPFDLSALEAVGDRLEDLPFETASRSAASLAGLQEEATNEAVEKKLRAENDLLRLSVSSSIDELESEEALVPVFIDLVTVRDTPFRYVVNAMSGATTGDVPFAWARLLLVVISAGAVAAALFLAIQAA